ncbi:MAG: helix-turn-helix domain-containing protein [Patescibacteria group bacterium]|nr:helix-turn-helix domain-containing protein [Patescibacteria group bacterium]
MAEFNFKKLASEERAGEKLRAARLRQNIDIKSAAKKLHIREEYLLSLENEEYDRLPAGLYGRQFLKEYCLYLKLKPQEIMNLSPFAEEGVSHNPFSQKILRRHKFLVFPKIIKNALLIFLFLICILYLSIYFRRLVSPPELILEYPDKNLVLQNPVITIQGKSEPETEIKVNGTGIMSEQDGSFSQEIKLKQGLNNLSISAKKKYGRESVIQRQILVENTYEQSQ